MYGCTHGNEPGLINAQLIAKGVSEADLNNSSQFKKKKAHNTRFY